MSDWKDYPRTKDKVAIVGFAESTRNMVPYDDDEYEIWSLNEGYTFDFIKRYDRWFQIHPRWDFARTNNVGAPNHLLWLRNRSDACILCKGTGKIQLPDKVIDCEKCDNGIYTPHEGREGTVIYMQEAYEDIPDAVKFPLEEATEFVGLGYPYFVSTCAFMVVLAAMMGYTSIELYGFDMRTETEYHYQRANFEYLIGLLQGRGYNIYIPRQSALLKDKLYGYENNQVGFHQNLEMRREQLKKNLNVAQRNIDRYYGRIKSLEEIKAELDNITKMSEFKSWLDERIAVKQDEALKHQETLNVVRGAASENEIVIGLHNNYFIGGADA